MNLTILRGRLGVFLFGLLVLTVVVGGSGLYYTRSLASELRGLSRGNLQAATHLANAERGMWELRFALPNYFLGDIDSRKNIDAGSERLIAAVNDNLRAYAAGAISAEERALLVQWDQAFARYLRARPQYFALVAAGKLDEAKEHRAKETNPPAAESVRVLAALIQLQQRLGDERAKGAEAEAAGASRIMSALVLLSLLVGGLLSTSLARHVAERVAEALRGVQRSSVELESTAAQQASSARELASATTEISVTIRELLATSRQISDSARSVATMTDETGQHARSGDALVKRAQDSLVTMRRKVDETVTQMLNLGKKSQQIGGILELINELAEQTNILAINARIEAAGAGEAGRRFAVVADEIRRLADRVASSSREIRGLVDEIRGAAGSAVMATEDGAKSVDLGGRQFDEVLVTFHQIAERVSDASVAARQIELGTKQQVSAVEQVNVAMGDVVRSARETESGSAHTLETCAELANVSRKLASFAGA